MNIKKFSSFDVLFDARITETRLLNIISPIIHSWKIIDQRVSPLPRLPVRNRNEFSRFFETRPFDSFAQRGTNSSKRDRNLSSGKLSSSRIIFEIVKFELLNSVTRIRRRKQSRTNPLRDTFQPLVNSPEREKKMKKKPPRNVLLCFFQPCSKVAKSCCKEMA